MKPIRISLFFLLCTLTVVVRGQSSDSGSTAHHTWLWQIQSGQAEAPSWIFASLHHPEPAFAAAFRHVEPWFDQATQFATVWPQDPSGKRLLEQALRLETHPLHAGGGKQLRKAYRSAEFEALEGLLQRRLGDALASHLDRFPLALMQQLVDAGRSPVGQRFAESSIADQAKDRGKPIRLLAQPDRLGALMAAVPLETQLDMLSAYGASPLPYEAALDALALAYQDADWDALQNQYQALHPALHSERLIEGLALHTATRLQQLSEQASGFYAIDAELLGGPKGLLERLKQLGIVAVPIELPAYGAQLRRALEDRISPVSLPATEAENSSTSPLAPEQANRGRGPLFDGLAADGQNQSGQAAPIWERDPFGDFRRTGEQDTSFLRRWDLYRGPDGDYRAPFPYRPNVDARLYRADGGTVDVKMAALNDAETELHYLVTRTEYPERFRRSDPVRFFDDAVEDTRLRFEGALVADRPLSTPLYRGREYVLAIPGGRFVRGQLLLADRTLYHLTLVGLPAKAWGPHADAFLDGFRIYRANVRSWALVEGDGFRVRMPLQPLRNQRRTETPEGPVDVKSWAMEDPLSDRAFLVSISAYPPSLTKRSKNFLDQIGYGTAARLGGQLIEEESIRSGRFRGREVHVAAPGMHYRIRFYLDGNTLYQVLVSGDQSVLESNDAAYFFSSFRFR